MTIGEKIYALRSADGISQEALADRLGVSRQSVSKWEMDQALPQIDKIMQLTRMFGVSADQLLCDSAEIDLSVSPAAPSDAPGFKKKYFGTDGFRGMANVDVNALQAFRIGRFVGWYYSSPLSGCRRRGHRPRVVVGKDTRRSSYMFEYALASGIACSGADVYMLHVTTTPSVSYVTRQEGFDCGIMISASHNPYTDNGIKLVNRYGEKMDIRTLSLCEAYLSGDLDALGVDGEDLPLATGEGIGAVIDHSAGRNRYVAYLISIASHSYKNMRIGLDCANGASWMIAPSVFDALGAQTYIINNRPDGLNINRDAGSTHIEALQELVRENKLDAGFAFDGDADRCIAVDDRANVVTGDHILYILAKRFMDRGILNSNGVVATVMSNSGLAKSLANIGIDCIESAVGDQNVYDKMLEGEYMLGGEQSGHIIMQKYATTGDGILTAIMLMEEIMDRKTSLSKLAAPLTVYPQILKNVRVCDKPAVGADPEIQEKVGFLNKQFGDEGRIILRESGTEPVIRVMAEGSDSEFCRRAVDSVCALISKKGYAEKG